MSGWSDLCSLYKIKDIPSNVSWIDTFAQPSLVKFWKGNGSTNQTPVRLGVSSRGLIVKPGSLITKILKPVMLLPWSDFKDSWMEVSVLGFTTKSIRLNFQRASNVFMDFSEDTGKKIKSQSKGYWNSGTV